MFHWPKIAKQPLQYKPLAFGPWPHGLCTVKPAFEIQSSELSYCLNLVALRGGRWKTRPAISKYTNTATTSNSAPKHFKLCPIGSNNYELLIDANDVLYYLDSSLDPIEIKDALEGVGTIQPFAGTAMIFDTSYIKFCDLLDVTGATKANPCVITYDGQNPSNGQSIEFNGIGGMTQLNGNSYTIAGLDTDAKTFQLSGINSSAYGVYTSGGVGAIIALAYDKGTGTSGYQFDNHTGDNDGYMLLNNSYSRAAWKFTSQSWDAGYTIPPVTFTVKASKTKETITISGATQANPCVITYTAGNPGNGMVFEINSVVGMTELNGNTYTVANLNAGAKTFELSGIDSTGYGVYTSGGIGISFLAAGALVAKLRLVANDSVLATKNILAAADDLTTTATEYSVTFLAEDTITTEMSPSTAYYMSVEYAVGTATNYAKIHYTTLGSGGHGYRYDGSWNALSTLDPIMSLRPGRPPKGSWGVVSDNHLIVYDPDNPGKPVFSAPGDHLDWSTSTLAGYVGAVDDNANNFAVGAMVDHYGDLFVFGTKAQPYLAKLTGSSPTNWKLPRLYQKVSSTHKTCLSVINDVWYASRDGVDGLSGVQEYGDLRTFFASDPIYDRIEDNWDEDTTIAGYYPADGQYFFYMAGDHRIQVAHTKIPSAIQNPEGGAYTRYPWGEYELYRDIFTDNVLYGFVISDSGTNEYRLFKWDEQDLDDDYTETDPSSDLTVTDDTITFTTVDKATECWVYKDFTASFFNVSFKQELQYKITSSDDGGIIGIWGMANTVDSVSDIDTASGSCLSLIAGRSGSDYTLQLREVDSGTAYNDSATLAVDTDYYLTIVRDENVGTYGTLYCYIYSDSDRETLLGTLSLTLHTSKKDFRYLYALQAIKGTTGVDISGEVSNLSIESDPSFDAQPDFILMNGNKITEDTVGSLDDHEWDYGDNDSLGYSTVYFADASGDPDTSGISLHSVLGPTMFEDHNNLFFIGGSDGYVHKVDTSEYKDQGSHKIRFALRSSYISFPFTHVHLVQQQIMAASLSGGELALKIWTDDQQSDVTYNLSIDDRLTVDQATMDGDDALFAVDPALVPRFTNININARSMQAGIEDIILAGYPLYIDGFLFKYKPLST